MEQAGGDHVVWLAVASQQPTHLDRMHDERRVVDLPVLAGVALGGELERGLRDRKPGEPVSGATAIERWRAGEVILEAAAVLLSHQAHGVSGHESPGLLR